MPTYKAERLDGLLAMNYERSPMTEKRLWNPPIFELLRIKGVSRIAAYYIDSAITHTIIS